MFLDDSSQGRPRVDLTVEWPLEERLLEILYVKVILQTRNRSKPLWLLAFPPYTHVHWCFCEQDLGSFRKLLLHVFGQRTCTDIVATSSCSPFPAVVPPKRHSFIIPSSCPSNKPEKRAAFETRNLTRNVPRKASPGTDGGL